MKLISVNVGKEQTLVNKNKIEQTGIFKHPVEGSVKIAALGIAEDCIVDQKNHGGVDQAIYVYGMKDYEWWESQIGRKMTPGMFGENLTIGDLECGSFDAGDYLIIGEVLLQVTAPRIPCGTFAGRMEDSQWVKKFREAERPGLYCRVLRGGTICAGDDVAVAKYSAETISVVQMYRDHYEKDRSEETLRKHLAAPISERERQKAEAELQKLSEQ
jgi:MOSC domain-containing protein YiiM